MHNIKKFKTLALIVLCLLGFAHCYGFNFKHYSIGQGLPSSEVFQVVQDNYGYIWFATNRGVCRYDGSEFKVFTKEDGLTDDVVFGFHLDYQNKLWFYTYHGGICYYYDGKIIQPDFNTEFVSLLNQGKTSPIIVSLFVESNNTLWVGTSAFEVYRIDQLTGEITMLSSASSSKRTVTLFDVEPEHNDGFVFCGKGWPANAFNKVNFVKPSSSQVTSVDLSDNPVGEGSVVRFSRWQDSIFIGANNDLLFKFSPSGLKEYVYLESSVLDCIMPDRAENLWVGTRDGVFCFKKGNIKSTPKRYLKGYEVSSFLQDNEGGYWFTTLNDGVKYLPNLDVYSLSNKALANNSLNELTSNKSGVYIKTGRSSLYLLQDGDINQIKLISNNHFGRLRYSREGGVFYDVEADSMLVDRNGKVEKIVGEEALLRSDPRSEFLWTHMLDSLYFQHTTLDSSFKIPAASKTSVATVMPFGNQAWFGDFRGLHTYENKRLIWLGDTLPELACRISDLDIIDAEHLLVSTRGKGALILNCRTFKLDRIEHIPTNHCNASLVDKDGNIWLATFLGVYKVENALNRPRVRHFSKNQGLISNEVVDIHAYQNKVYVATTMGLSVFDLDWIPKDLVHSNLEVLNVKINHEDVHLLDAYSLNYYQNNLSITTSVISYMKPVDYEYKMSGLQEDWISTQNKKITFSNLEPGRYILHLRVSDQTNLSQIKKVYFNIVAPFWSRLWFKITVLFVVTALTFFILGTRYRLVKKADKLYDLFVHSEQKALRAQISPHFLFNALSSALALVMQKKNEAVSRYLLNVSSLMRRVLEYSRREEISVKEEKEFLEFYLKVERERSEYNFDYKVTIGSGLEPSSLLLPPLIIQPYVENAIKHGVISRKSGGAEIQITFFSDLDKLKVEICDNGIGYNSKERKSPKKRSSIGMKINKERFRLFSQSKRYNFQIGNLVEHKPDAKFKGTRVTLTFPLSTTN